MSHGTDVLGAVFDHRKALHAQTEVHNGDFDAVCRKRMRGIHAEGSDLDPAVRRVLRIDLGLGVGDIVFRALVVGSELEVREAERRKETCGNRFSVLNAHAFAGDDTRRRVIGHEACGSLLLFAAETAVDGKHPNRKRHLVPHRAKRHEPARGHVRAQGNPRGFGNKLLELGEDLFEDVYDESVVGVEDNGKLVGEFIAVDLGLFVGMQGLSEVFFGLGVHGVTDYLCNAVELFLSDSHIRTRKTADIEDAVEHGGSLGSELFVDLAFVDEDGHACLIKAHHQICFAESLNGLRNGVLLCASDYVSRIPLRDRNGLHNLRALVPCRLKIGFGKFSELFCAEFHIIAAVLLCLPVIIL